MTPVRKCFQSGCLASAILGVYLAGVSMNVAFGQTPPPSPEGHSAQIPEKVAPPLENDAKQPNMEREDGVIKPKRDVDPSITTKPLETGARMPVIPPPGSPGGDKSINPK